MQRDSRNKPNLLDLAKVWLKMRHDKPGRVFLGMVHRLDAPVAGVLVMARTSKAAGRLSAQFRQGTVAKTYLAVVEGQPGRQADRLVHSLVRRGRYSRIAPRGDSEGRTAALSYRLRDCREARSLLEVRLETGRRHQIRAQLAAIGCPIWGDIAYGAGQRLPDGCIGLMAHRLAVTHPTRQVPMRFESPTPDGWPWPVTDATVPRPLWSLEAYLRNGLHLPPSFDGDPM